MIARSRLGKKSTTWIGTWVLASVLSIAGPFAIDAGARDSSASEPRVARVALVEGEVSYLNGDAESWTPVDVNAPLVGGDRFYAGPDGRAELQLGPGFYARVASDTEIDVLDLTSDATQVRVGIGTAIFRLGTPPADRYVEISTPGAAIAPRERGLYRVDVDRDGRTTVLVREGEADAYQGDQRYRLASGRGAEFFVPSGDGGEPTEPLRVFDATAVERDTWDDWDHGRDARVVASASARYVSPDVYGAEDLDEYGDWQRTPDYGPVWRPTHVEAGWAPFTNGRWVWQDPWGWTWVDYAPWGWAPSHYGRWVYVNDYWGWAPGPVVVRPAYAPAVVGFLGVSINTPNVSVSVGIGPSVGWVPLGYGEPVFPWWGGVGGVVVGRPWWGGWGGPRIVNNRVINQTNITNITNINYVNIDRPRGFTAVSREDFVTGHVRRLDMSHDQIRDMRPIRGNPGIVPRRDSLVAARPERVRDARTVAPPREVIDRASVTNRKPINERPKFAQKIDLIERNQGAPVAPTEMRRLAKESPATVVPTIQARGSRVVVPQTNAVAPERPGNEASRQVRAGLERGQPGGSEAVRARPDGREPGAAQQGMPSNAGDRRARPSDRESGRDRENPPVNLADQPRTERQQREAPGRSQDQAETTRERGPATRQQQQPAEQGQQREAAGRAQQQEEASQQREQATRQQQQERQAVQRQQQEAAGRAQQQEEASQRREQATRQQQQERQAVQRQQQEAASRAQQQEEASQRREQATRQQQQERQAVQRQQQEAASRAQQQEEANQRREQATRQQQERQAVQRQQQEAAGRAQQQAEASRQREQAQQHQVEQRQQREAAGRARQEEASRQRDQAMRDQKQRQEEQRRQRDAAAQSRESHQAEQQRKAQVARGQQQQQAPRNQRRAPGRDGAERDGG